MTNSHPTSRRWDGRPETDADRRFFDLRESGYTGPIDQDGHAVADLNPRKVNTMTELTEITPADAAAIAEVDAEFDAESAADELDDLAGDVYMTLSDAEDELDKLATRIELFGAHPSEPSTYDLDRHLAAARAALEALAAAMTPDGVHKHYPAGHPRARH